MMDEDAPEPDQYEEQLRELFDGFDASGAGALTCAELSDLCTALQLGDATPALLHALLLGPRDSMTESCGRVGTTGSHGAPATWPTACNEPMGFEGGRGRLCGSLPPKSCPLTLFPFLGIFVVCSPST